MDVKTKQAAAREKKGKAIYLVHFNGIEALAARDIGGVRFAKSETRWRGSVPELKRGSAWECKTQASVLQLKQGGWRRGHRNTQLGDLP